MKVSSMSVWAMALAVVIGSPAASFAVADSIMGVDSTTGIPEVLDPAAAGALIGATGTTLQDAFDGGKVISGANSETNAFQVGGTNKFKFFDDPTDGLIIKPSPLADSVINAWTNQNIVFGDVENACDILTIDPDAASPNAAWTFGCPASKPKRKQLLGVSPRGAVAMSEESIVTNQPKSWYATLTDANTDAVDFSLTVKPSMAGITTMTITLFGVSKNASPSGNIALDCAVKSYRPGTDTFAAHSTTGEQRITLTPETQNRPVSGTTSAITINGTVAAGAMLFGSCEVDATATTSAQMSDFRLWGFAEVTYDAASLSE